MSANPIAQRNPPAARAGLAAGASLHWWIAGVLALLMAATRGQHFASVDALPSASWAVFFLAGALLPSRWMFGALFALATLLDFGSLAAGTITDWCTSPAYWVLLPAYASLWFGGRVYARVHRDEWRTVARLAVVLVATAVVAYAWSKGGFYFLSGRYPEPTWAGFVARIPQYFPQALGVLAGYAGVGIALHVLLRSMRSRAAAAVGARA